MATFIKIADFVEAGMEGFLDLDDQTKIFFDLVLTAPGSESPDPTLAGNGVLANITVISYTNYEDSLGTDRLLNSITSTVSGTTWKLDHSDFTINAGSGGALADWRYFYIWDDASVSPTDSLIGLWDHGSTISLAANEIANININTSGLITIA